MLFTGDWFVGASGDLPTMQYQERAFTFASLKQGILPLWNPRIFSGTPWSVGVRPAHYPGHLLGVLLPVQWEVKWSLVLHQALALWGAWLMCRGRRASPLAACLGATTFALSARFISHAWAGHLDVCTTLAWCPWMIWSACRFAARPTPVRLAVACLVGALQLSCGHMQVVYLTGWTLGALLLCGQLPGRPAPARALVCLAGAALAICTLAAFQLLPSSVNMLSSNRFDRGADFARGSAPGFWSLLGLTSPHLFEDVAGGGGWCKWPVWEGNFYLGIVPLTLAGLWLSSGFRRARLLIPVLLGLALCVADATPIFEPYLGLDPIVAKFRAPGRFGIAVLLLLSMAAASGWDLLRRRPQRARRLALGLSILSGFQLLVWAMFRFPFNTAMLNLLIDSLDPGRRANLSKANLPLLFATGGRYALGSALLGVVSLLALRLPPRRRGLALLLLPLADFVLQGRPYNRCQPELEAMPVTEVGRQMAPLARGLDRFRTPDRLNNLSMLCGYDDIGGYSTFLNDDYSKAVCLNYDMRPDSFLVSVHDGPRQELCSMLSGRFLVSEGNPEPGCEPISQIGIYRVYLNPDAYPRFYLAHAARVGRQRGNTMPEAFRRWRELVQVPLLDPASAGAAAGLPVGSAHTQPAEVGDAFVGINHAGCRTDSAQTGLLVMTDSPAAGWAVSVDGKPAELLKVNGDLHRGVVVPPGRHLIRFSYFPDALTRGLWISALGWAALLAAMAGPAAARRIR